MITIVSGFPRSGTSCMMSALIAGGMDAAWSDERNQMADAHADQHYHPNADGLYEVPLREYGEIDFPLKYQGKLIKVMLWGLDGLAVNPYGYRVIIMRRDPEEIRQSYEAFFGQPLRHPWMREYEQRIQRAQEMLANRNDVFCAEIIDYESLVSNPVARFKWLVANAWPEFDIARAAATIDASRYRFRRELLTVGL